MVKRPDDVDTLVPTLPPIGTCVLAAWHVVDGDRVKAGDLLADVEADKAIMEWRAPIDCVVQRRLVPVGAVLAEGRPLARLDAGVVRVEFGYREWKR